MSGGMVDVKRQRNKQRAGKKNHNAINENKTTMKKYLRELEVSGLILVIIGIAMSWIVGSRFGMWPCSIGLLLWLVTFLYKAFHWNEYERENRQNIMILVIAIVILLAQMFIRL